MLFVIISYPNAWGGHGPFPIPAGQTPAEQSPAQAKTVKSLLDCYLRIQLALANDSLDHVGSSASAMGGLVRDAPMPALSPELMAEADALARTKDLFIARLVFKRLSKSLIKYLRNYYGSKDYVVLYCRVAKASWVQRGGRINNPYLGARNPNCGEIRRRGKRADSGKRDATSGNV